MTKLELKPRFICRHDGELMRVRSLVTGLHDSWTFQCVKCLRWFDVPLWTLTPDEVIEGLARAKLVKGGE